MKKNKAIGVVVAIACGGPVYEAEEEAYFFKTSKYEIGRASCRERV